MSKIIFTFTLDTDTGESDNIGNVDVVTALKLLQEIVVATLVTNKLGLLEAAKKEKSQRKKIKNRQIGLDKTTK